MIFLNNMQTVQSKFIEMFEALIDTIKDPTEEAKAIIDKYRGYVNLYYYNDYKKLMCKHEHTIQIKMDNSFPYGKDIKYDQCSDCGETFNYDSR
jgi:hypothetical protein